jgi:hypothetical protein
MNRQILIVSGAMIATLAAAVAFGDEATNQTAARPAQTWKSAVQSKPISPAVKKGLTWLIERQQGSGGWAQGEESANMGRGMDGVKDQANVGDSCAALLALLRSGSTPSSGDYAAPILNGVRFVCGEIEKADSDSLFVTKTRGTRLQAKLGAYVDTFLASLLLAEVGKTMPTPEEQARVAAAQAKVMAKIEKNQREDGSFGGEGWANALSQGLAAKGINRSAQTGVAVSESVRGKLEQRAGKRFDAKGGSFSRDDAAGVDLYAVASSVGAMQDSDNTNNDKKRELEKTVRTAESPGARKEAQQLLDRYQVNSDTLAAAKKAAVSKLDNDQFVSGFGSNGGEEFLSYMTIGESLVVGGGAEWSTWDKKMTANLERIQNGDGSWTGHHCITGRSFCTAAALLVLMTDRAPVPLSADFKRR